MCNCNQQRASYTSEQKSEQTGMIKVTLVGNKPIVIYGDITGRMYIFRKKNDSNWVDKRDAVSFSGVEGIKISSN